MLPACLFLLTKASQADATKIQALLGNLRAQMF